MNQRPGAGGGSDIVDRRFGRKRVRIVHVVLQLDTGGMEKLLVEFARHADRSRFELRFICLGARGRIADEIEEAGWPVMALREPPGLHPRLVLRLARILRHWRADIVHTHNSKPLVYSAPAGRLAGAFRIIHTQHGQRLGATWAQTALYRLAAEFTDAVVCVSHDSARCVVRQGMRPAKVRVVWNGIDTARFSYVGPDSDGPVVMVGRLSPEKDVETLIRATSLAIRQWPGFRLMIAGAGPCLSSLQRLTVDLGVAGFVQFLGNVNDIPALLARASVAVLPSLREGLPLTLLEAMSRGLPVVATRVGGNPEVVVEGETGMLVPAGYPDRLADAMLRMRLDSRLGRQMGAAGRRRVESEFDARGMVETYESLYRANGIG